MEGSLAKKYDKEVLQKLSDDVLFDVLNHSSVEDIDDVAFKVLIKECLVRIFYSDSDFYTYGMED